MSRYFDFAATHPMRQVAVDAWVEASGALNSGAVYASGRRARSVLDQARETVAELLGCEPIEVIFTASGTESDNIAVQGLYATRVAAGAPARIVSTPIEHPAVLQPVSKLRESGVQVDLLPVDVRGHIPDLAQLDTPAALATCMWANNETGAILPVARICEKAAAVDTPVHIDAVQAVGKVPVDFAAVGATTLAASAHKFGGPRGAGLLLAKRSPAPQAVNYGGGQERGIRPGTVDVAAASALAAALQEAVAEMAEESRRVRALRERLRDGVVARIPEVGVYTHEPALPGHLSLSFVGTDSDSLILLLDMEGIEASAGSACAAGVNRQSHVLAAMGVGADTGSLRFTLGSSTTVEDVDFVIQRLPEVIKRARSV
ncbi:cysteine desulfurase [Corynebacterium phocae]|uniref:Cysteine desulfurase n=1 Tax=Corynebacterium phocae TaxID=161895 RepID=A0A1L7D3K2_9CORY|nr:cysteine desulfurase family protein [Corynebacterium phocae]APT92746.1 cysteine desulfurase [Corynebacterium phocae]KAA8723057.1 cysteine desulfurase [Corynebacterium phocae]